MKKRDYSDIFRKNYLKMNLLIRANSGNFLLEIKKARNIFHIPERPILNLAKFGRGKNFENIQKTSDNLIQKFLKENEKKLFSFYSELKKSRKKLGLGREWNTTLMRVIVSGVLIPPPYSVFYYQNEEDKTLVFEINKDTTRDEFDLAWKHSEDLRKEIFGKTRAVFPMKKTIDNYNKLFEYEEVKRKKRTEMNVVAWKKYKKSELDIIGEIYSSEDNALNKVDEDIKRLGKLKVAKSRFGKVAN